MNINKCKNCNEQINGNYCSNCGQPANLKRIDGRYIVHEIAHIFHAERGLLYTLKKMLTSPGKSIRQFVTEDRSRYMKPVTFLIITGLIYTIVCQLFHIDAKYFYLQTSSEEIPFPTVNFILNWMVTHQGYAGIIIGLFMAFWIKLFFRKSGYNIFEIFILICYVSGISLLFHSMIVVIEAVTHLRLLHIANGIVLAYFAWAAVQFFNTKKIVSFIKALLSYGLGCFIFGILVAMVALFIDIVIKH
jgi:hypothetical protein